MKANIIKIIKTYLSEFLFITISCFVSLILYGVVTLPLRGIILNMEGTPYEKPYLLALSVIITVIFSLVLLFFKKKIKNVCEKEVLEDYKNKDYNGLLNDIKISFLNGDFTTLALISFINIVAIIFSKADALMLWSPMFFFKTVIANNVIAHILSILITSLTYYLFLAFYRRKIFKKWNLSIRKDNNS